MGTKDRKVVEASQSSDETRGGTGLDTVNDLATKEVLREGVTSVAGAARFSIAAAKDMLDGKLTAQEATVVNTTAGRVLKAAELYLKYARGSNPKLSLPDC
jgi:hypothetical protein